MNINELKSQSELGLVASLKDIIRINTKSRIYGLANNASKKAYKEIKKKPLLNKKETEIVQQKFKKFEKLTKWDTNPRHLISYVSALLEIIEHTNWSEMKDDLVEIIDFFERKNKIPPGCFWSGKVTKQKWDESWR